MEECLVQLKVVGWSSGDGGLGLEYQDGWLSCPSMNIKDFLFCLPPFSDHQVFVGFLGFLYLPPPCLPVENRGEKVLRL